MQQIYRHWLSRFHWAKRFRSWFLHYYFKLLSHKLAGGNSTPLKAVSSIQEIKAVKEWSVSQGKCYRSILPNRELRINRPQFVNQNLSEEEKGFSTSGVVTLPEAYCASIGNAIVIGQTTAVITPTACLYDEQAASFGRYVPRTTAISQNLNWAKRVEEVRVGIHGQAIHLCDDYSPNWFHWLIECLPRIWVINQFPEYAKVPLLIDGALPSTCIESLNQIKGERQLIKLNKHTHCHVEELIYPSALSVIHDNYNHRKMMDDVLIAPEGIEFVRNSFITRQGEKKKIFLARRSPGYRELVNSIEIESMLSQEGFEIIFPEKLSFHDQVTLFSQASMIVSQTSAGLTNMIFAPRGCKIFALTTKSIHNYYVFNVLADICQLDLQYILGDPIPRTSMYKVHESFTVPLEIIRNAIRK